MSRVFCSFEADVAIGAASRHFGLSERSFYCHLNRNRLRVLEIVAPKKIEKETPGGAIDTTI